MNFLLFKARGNIKKIISLCILIISLSFSACGDTGANTENSSQISYVKPSASDAASQSDHEANPLCLRYDGLYCYIDDSDHDGFIDNNVLRFYEDGVVIHASIEQTESNKGYFPHESWFNKETESYLGSYECMDDKISFTTTGEYGTVDYDGIVQQNQLILDSHSNINGHDAFNQKYVFYPFEDIPDWYN